MISSILESHFWSYDMCTMFSTHDWPYIQIGSISDHSSTLHYPMSNLSVHNIIEHELFQYEEPSSLRSHTYLIPWRCSRTRDLLELSHLLLIKRRPNDYVGWRLCAFRRWEDFSPVSTFFLAVTRSKCNSTHKIGICFATMRGVTSLSSILSLQSLELWS